MRELLDPAVLDRDAGKFVQRVVELRGGIVRGILQRSDRLICSAAHMSERLVGSVVWGAHPSTLSRGGGRCLSVR